MDKMTETVEKWAMSYRLMRHDPAPDSPNRRFFFCDGDQGLRDIIQHVLPESSPFVMLDSEISGVKSSLCFRRFYRIFFVVRCRKMASDEELYRGNEEALTHADRFYAYLNGHADGQWRRMMDLDNVTVQSYNIGLDGWTSVMMTIEAATQTDLCGDDDLYD